MSELVYCGSFIEEDNNEADVLCDPHTGELIIDCGLNGPTIVGNVSVSEPVNMSGTSLEQFYSCTGEGTVGVAVTKKYLLIFKRDVVEYRLMTSPLKVESTTSYDLDISYEGELD